ncbi:MAG: alpha/beta fold hydrolase [Pseudomonadota bacterium]
MEPRHYDRLLALLDKAYAAPFEPLNFHGLMNAAHNFYFGDDEDLRVTGQVISEFDRNALVENHLRRIERLLVDRELENRKNPTSISRPTLLALLIDQETQMVRGDAETDALFGQALPAKLRDLNVDDATRRALTQLLDRAANQSDFTSEPCLIRRSNDKTAFIAKCGLWIDPEAPVPSQRKGLAVSIAHFVWTHGALSFCQSMFALTNSEIEILAGLLNGKTQREIAEERGRSVETIKAQAKNVLRKSGCSRLSELIVIATTYGVLIDPDTAPASDYGRSRLAFSRPDRTMKTNAGRKISYSIVGANKGASVVFIHGLIQGPFFTDSMQQRLADNDITMLAPSRPGFGMTDPPSDWNHFDEQAVRDTLMLIEKHLDGPITVVAHQGGVSHAFRIAAALGDRLSNMVMIGAGIPIDEKKHVPAMGLQTRIAAIGVKYTPRILETMIRVAIANEMRAGIKSWLTHFFSNSAVDRDAILEPSVFAICEASVVHMIDQGSRAMVRDGMSAMADWNEDFLSVKCPQFWIHGTADPIMRHDFVMEYLAPHKHCSFQTIKNGGNTMHIVSEEPVVQQIINAARAQVTSDK